MRLPLVFTLLPALAAQDGSSPPELRTSITVLEHVEAETPAPPQVFARPELARLPGVNLDDRLRLVPGFSLFRRTSSLAANPTTQGVSLRGLGSTGASRTLVLFDGVPLNSPFGGWVYWTRVSPAELERVEVVRSAPSSVFGDRAMGGAVSLWSRAPGARWFDASYESGNRNTHEITAQAAAMLRRGWSAAASARLFHTDGWLVVPPEVRGAVDQPAGVRFAAAGTRASWSGASQSLSLRFDLLTEDRANGTVLQRNSTSLGTVAGNYSRALGRSWNLSALAFHNREEFRSAFSAIAPDRAAERLTARQSVPAEGTGAAGFLRRQKTRWNFLTGADLNRAEGYSRETLFPAGFRLGGGVQTQHGWFAQGDARAGRAQLFAGLRRHSTASATFWNPSAGAAAGFGRLRLHASANRAFRAPTLNELFREFRAGNAVTLPNPALRPETLRGFETGASWRGEAFQASAHAFHNRLEDIIVNVTRSVTPSLITRQRDNAAAATVRGVETSFRWRRGSWLADASHLLADSRFSTRLLIPQVPRRNGNFTLTWSRPATLLSAGVRASSLQFEDDLNRFPLPGFHIWHFAARQRLAGALFASLTLENALNRQIIAGFTPAPLLGSPRLIRAGLRWQRF